MNLLKFLRPKFDEKYSYGLCEQIHLKLATHIPYLNEYIIRNFSDSINSFIYVSGFSIITQSKISDEAKALLIPAWGNYNVHISSLSIQNLVEIRSKYIDDFIESVHPFGDYDFFERMILYYVGVHLETIDYEMDGMEKMRIEYPPLELMRWFKITVFEIQKSLEIIMLKFRSV